MVTDINRRCKIFLLKLKYSGRCCALAKLIGMLLKKIEECLNGGLKIISFFY